MRKKKLRTRPASQITKADGKKKTAIPRVSLQSQRDHRL